MIFNYNKLVWTTGRSLQSGGDSAGIGGIPAQVYQLSEVIFFANMFLALNRFFVYTNRQDLMLVTVFAILISRDLVPVKCSIYLTSRMLECQVDGCSVLTTLKSKPQAVIQKVGVEQHFTRVLFRRGVGNQG